MSRTLALALLGVPLALWGCAEPLAPRPEATLGSIERQEGAMMSRKRGDDGAIVEGKGSPLDVHAVNVAISSKPFGDLVIDRYSFHVHGRPGAMKGKFKLYQVRVIDGESVAVVVAGGRMDCGSIQGNQAHAGGTITETSFPEPGGLPVGGQLTWTVTDNGQGSKVTDTASQPLGANSQAHCVTPVYDYPEQAVERGHVKIRG